MPICRVVITIVRLQHEVFPTTWILRLCWPDMGRLLVEFIRSYASSHPEVAPEGHIEGRER